MALMVNLKSGDIILFEESNNFFKKKRIYGWKGKSGQTGVGLYVNFYSNPYISHYGNGVSLSKIDEIKISGVYRTPEYLSPIARERLEGRVFATFMDYNTSQVKLLKDAVVRRHKDEEDVAYVKAILAVDVGAKNSDIINMSAKKLYKGDYEYLKRVL